jgi:hypothetical protein
VSVLKSLATSQLSPVRSSNNQGAREKNLLQQGRELEKQHPLQLVMILVIEVLLSWVFVLVVLMVELFLVIPGCYDLSIKCPQKIHVECLAHRVTLF